MIIVVVDGVSVLLNNNGHPDTIIRLSGAEIIE